MRSTTSIGSPDVFHCVRLAEVVCLITYIFAIFGVVLISAFAFGAWARPMPKRMSEK